MKKIASYVLMAAAMIAVVSCNNQGFKKTKSGLLYKIISDGKGEPAKKGEFLKMDFVQKVRDSIIGSTDKMGMPIYMPVDSVGPVYAPAEIFGLLRKGDSATVVMLADTLARKYGGQLPPFIKKKDKIVLTLKVLDVFTNDSLVKVDRTKILDAEKDKEVKQIEEYLSKNNIAGATKTKDGVYYQITSSGNGPQVDSGKVVSINYTGYSFEGKPFDSNIDSTKQTQRHPLQPFEFKAGVGGAIQGMVKAITLFKKGDKVKLYIPGILGYGPQGSGNVIKPNENLMFDIEVVDVKDAPKVDQRPPFPMPQQMKPATPKTATKK
ncbi:MAG: FKBP-type peptidyl-prolyl cis-trans isomerase [Bacteroidetes bacterium]|nr:FKBP-type peptidyl-prolyl cis-trans isomerase [Bacteroidota bacterium]